MHTVGGVETDKLDNVRLGDTVVVVFTEALVLSLKRSNRDAERKRPGTRRAFFYELTMLRC